MTPGEQPTVWTIGHSTRPIEEFLSLLAEHQIELLVDVRRFPVSKRYAQYNEANLRSSLTEVGVDYLWLPELGGRRNPRRDSPNTAWRNAGFRGYADHMMTREFRDGFERVIESAELSRVAVMCSESVWWRCHRGLISDALVVAGLRVVHIMGPGTSAEHPMTPPARIVDGKLSYRAEKDGQAELL
jgi:uncharacterized protein (DUF488 family)